MLGRIIDQSELGGFSPFLGSNKAKNSVGKPSLVKRRECASSGPFVFTILRSSAGGDEDGPKRRQSGP